MLKLKGFIGQTLILAAIAAGPANAQDARPTFAVVEFEATPSGSTIPPPHLGEVAAQLVIDRLVEDAAIRVLDGRWLQSHQSGADRPAAARDLRASAEKAGVDYVVSGTINRFSVESRQRSGGLLSRRFLGGLSRQRNELAVSIWVTVVDVRTGEIVGTTSGTGVGKRSKLGVGGLKGLVAGGLTSGSTGSRDSQVDEALRMAADEASAGVLNTAARVSKITVAHGHDTAQ
jgi:curli biogenesis system outer membrane secretion channel CsgG